jgi:hypothetical protein
MISKVSLEPVAWCIRFGSWVKCIPFVWDDERNLILLLKDTNAARKKKYSRYYFWLISELLNFMIEHCLLYFLVYKVRYGKNIQPEEIILALFFILIILLSFSADVVIFQRTSDIKLMTNSILDLNQLLGLAPSE